MSNAPPSDLEKQAEAALTPAINAVEASTKDIQTIMTADSAKIVTTVESDVRGPAKLVEQLPSAACFRMGELYTHSTAVLGHLAQLAEGKLEAEEQAVVAELKAGLAKVQELTRKLFHTDTAKP